jgi:uncharacterized protein
VSFTSLPAVAAWRHLDARVGFESVFFALDPGGVRIEGRTCALEDGQVWDVGYVIEADDRWRTTRARVTSRSVAGRSTRVVESAGEGRWLVDGSPAPALDGCFDVDLESSACTNLLPVHRLALAVGAGADAPAAYVRAPGLEVERLEQAYRLLGDDDGPRYGYTAPRFEADCVLAFDPSGLVVDYPGLATRAW